ncbi:hypothetical protein LOAG_10479 [Loa loa]|uniref:Uncharacterized protein n=1 Tax=Loa loa TaxID=7209 RepID=A0A1I7VJR6_LOALO|nr:hypothetical protein LOAG_10479 [Loa loa]EFO18019.1 hypothetical protein LOAG_10479 [Loa loa]
MISSRSSPGGTPGPFGRIQQKQNFSDIAKEINKLKRTNRASLLNKKENSKLIETIESQFPLKLIQYNFNEQSQSKVPSTATFEQQQDENVVRHDKGTDATIVKSDQLSRNDENSIIKLSVKQRAQMFETVLAHANQSTIPMHNQRFVNKLNNYSSNSIIQRKKHCAGTPMPKNQQTFATISIPNK